MREKIEREKIGLEREKSLFIFKFCNLNYISVFRGSLELESYSQAPPNVALWDTQFDGEEDLP